MHTARRADGITGYLQIYNDWSRLEVSLRSLAAHLDEIVLVDGAYDWMKEYAEGIGWTPERSQPEVYEILDRSGIPYRAIQRTWKNQLEKRIAGYNACNTKYALRIDADEVLTFDEDRLSEFFASDHAIASMYMHLHVTPDYVLVQESDKRRIAVQPVLFDKERVSAETHLNYIFLVLPADSLPEEGRRPFAAFPTPVATCSHLTRLRHPRSAVFRGSYYYINWMRANGVGWIPNLRGRPLTDSSDLFREVPPKQFRDVMMNSHFVAGWADPNKPDYALKHSSTLTPSELSDEKKEALQKSFDDYLASLAELNAGLVEGRFFRKYDDIILDATTEQALSAIAPRGMLTVECDDPIEDLSARSVSLFSHEPWERCGNLPVAHESVPGGARALIDLSSLGPLQDGELRRTVNIHMKMPSTRSVHKFKLVVPTPEGESAPG